MGNNADRHMIKHLEQMLSEYNQEKAALNQAIAQTNGAVKPVTADEIMMDVQQLYSLKHNGNKIKELFIKQNVARGNENQSLKREYIHPTTKKMFKAKNRQKKPKPKQNLEPKTYNNKAEDFSSSVHMPPPLMNQNSKFRGSAHQPTHLTGRQSTFYNHQQNSTSNRYNHNNERSTAQHLRFRSGEVNCDIITYPQYRNDQRNNYQKRQNESNPTGPYNPPPSYRDAMNYNCNDPYCQSSNEQNRYSPHNHPPPRNNHPPPMPPPHNHHPPHNHYHHQPRSNHFEQGAIGNYHQRDMDNNHQRGRYNTGPEFQRPRITPDGVYPSNGQFCNTNLDQSRRSASRGQNRNPRGNYRRAHSQGRSHHSFEVFNSDSDHSNRPNNY